MQIRSVIYFDGVKVTETFSGVSQVGFHNVNVVAWDSSGNKSFQSRLFEIRDREYFGAKTVPQESSFEPLDPTHTSGVVTLLMGSNEFDVKTICLPSMQLWLLDAAGRSLNSRGITIAGGYPTPESNFVHSSAEVDYRECYWRLTFRTVLTVYNNAAVTFALTGTGRHQNGSYFDFVSRTANTVPANPSAALAIDINLCQDPPTPPPPPPPPPCRWKQQLIKNPNDVATESWSSGDSGWWINLLATPTYISGTAHAHSSFFGVAAGVSRAVASGGLLKVFIDPPNCCASCDISIVAQPKFKVHVHYNPSATAAGWGQISIAAPCGSTAAQGGLAIGSYDGGLTTVDVNGYPVPIYVGADDESETACTGNMSCVVNACSVDVSIVTSAALDVSADGLYWNWIAAANATIFDAALGLTVTPHDTCNATHGGPIVIGEWVDTTNDVP